jgi:hypothetical protein
MSPPVEVCLPARFHREKGFSARKTVRADKTQERPDFAATMASSFWNIFDYFGMGCNKPISSNTFGSLKFVPTPPSKSNFEGGFLFLF